MERDGGRHGGDGVDERELTSLGKPFSAVFGEHDFVTLVLEQGREHSTHGGTIFDQQDATRRCHPDLLCHARERPPLERLHRLGIIRMSETYSRYGAVGTTV